MSDIFDVLETCLQELENGADMESVLARYPNHAGELRPILKASVVARSMSAPAPSTDAVRRGRAMVLQHAAQMREAKSAPRSKRVIPLFQRLAIALTLAALFLTSGTGLVSASSSALPGENLYPVKLTWENIRLFFTFNEEARESLEHSFKNERLHEVNELLVEGRDETIRFAGIYMEVNGATYVSGIRVVVLENSILPAEPLSSGAAVMVTGHTNAQGFVDVESIELLPAGSVVPEGQPVEVESGQDVKNNEDNKVGDQEDAKDNDNANDHGDDSADDSHKVNNNDDGDDNSNNDGSEDNSGKDNGNDSKDDGGDDNGSDHSGSGGGDDNGDGGDDGGDSSSGGDD
ncbi:hypothetical protein ANAEL_03619 [Anaerolineales bacterium]|nr:hypothetical protein ANAEL_03619 [Anaerolineales bacterium]